MQCNSVKCDSTSAQHDGTNSKSDGKAQESVVQRTNYVIECRESNQGS